MQDVPKIVRERLRAGTPVTSQVSPNHPDADVLTAFAEQSLPERERAVLLEHLARCSDCRDIVALALPETEQVATVNRAAARGWLSWPTLRWGLVAAGIVAIASVGIVQYERRPEKLASYAPARVDVTVNQPTNGSADQASKQAAEQSREKSALPSASSGLTKKAENLSAPPPSAFADSMAANDSGIYD